MGHKIIDVVHQVSWSKVTKGNHFHSLITSLFLVPGISVMSNDEKVPLGKELKERGLARFQLQDLFFLSGQLSQNAPTEVDKADEE